MKTLLTMAQNISLETGLPTLSALVTNGSEQARTLLAIAKRSAEDLANRRNWSALTDEYEFQLVKNQPSYDLPEDFRCFLNDTFWDRVESRPVENVTPQVWQEFKSGLVTTAIYKRWRVKADGFEKKLFIDPTPAANQCAYECRDGVQVKLGCVFEYRSSYPVRAANGAPKATFTADTDTFRIDDTLLELDMKWRLLRALEQSYAEEKYEFDRWLGILKAQDAQPKTISADGASHRLRYPNIPESGIGIA